MNEYQDKDYIDKEYDQKKYLQKNKNINIMFLGIGILGLGLIAFMPDFIFVPAIESMDIEILLLFVGVSIGAIFMLCKSLLKLKYIHILTEANAISRNTNFYLQIRQERSVTSVIAVPFILTWILLSHTLTIFNIFDIYIPIFALILCIGSVFFLDGKFWEIYYKADLPFRIEAYQLAIVIMALYAIATFTFAWNIMLNPKPLFSFIISCLVSASVLSIPFYSKILILIKNNQSTTP